MLPPEQHFIRTHPDIMDISIYIDDVVVLDSTDFLNMHLDLQTLLLYYLMYHNISLPVLIHAAPGWSNSTRALRGTFSINSYDRSDTCRPISSCFLHFLCLFRQRDHMQLLLTRNNQVYYFSLSSLCAQHPLYRKCQSSAIGLISTEYKS